MSMDNHPSQQQSPYSEISQHQYQEISQDSRNLGVLTHLSTFAGYLFPFGNIIAPLVIWLVKKDTNAFVAEQGKEALNFQISITIYMLVAMALTFVLIGFILVPALIILHIVLAIMAALESNKGLTYRYPLTIRLIT
ncbi:MAG: DUF4870 domain-containing protein [Chloroflexi bacterium AL-W]|nr:DUF4870 domain-containing protein [Chloroflexi bacterium AL-N1]NOK67762.1 DUF4870 domain-containing protein [Chloroflexi bacterium AL-N10]NOK75468.1 DUF4870 domain-containing protein [Chloroflexi bacterium AL-N5]NOK82256.1 DUF4870 domain-containing protein [Chloroflexi bacterium AL-W]NOK90101.1 DUF4870 domain-containing protein [Chloroflexi bacterium AL-N15]